MVTDSADRPLLKISGDIDLGSVPKLLASAHQAVADATTVTRLLVDLADVTFIDSSGLGALLQIRNSLAETGSMLVVVAQSRSVELAVRYAGLADVFELGKGL